jgi:UDP-glucose 4-epimerase
MGSSEYVFVVGGAGYIGSHVCKELARRGYTPVVFDNLEYGHRDLARWGEFILGDLANPEQIRLAFACYPVSAVMHFAAYTYVGESVSEPDKYYRNNVAGTLNLLRTMREFGVDRFIFSSTAAVYGEPKIVPIPENHVQWPINPYGWSKFMVERVIEDFGRAYGLKSAALRYFNAAGADPDGETGERHDPETHLLPLVLQAAMGMRENITVFGTDYATSDGTCVRDYVHVSDLADAHVLALEYLGTEGVSAKGEASVFNLGNGQGFSVREVIETANNVTGLDIPVVEGQRRAGDPPRLVAASQKANDVLGWTPRYARLDDIVRTAWDWQRKDCKKGQVS